MKSDLQLHRDVLDELSCDPKVMEKEIAISAKDGVVTLTGSVETYDDKWAAERAAARVAGVLAVANDLLVTQEGAPPNSDTEIAHRIVEAFAWNIEVPYETIKASVVNGWVTLEGAVEWQHQRDAAARAVRYLPGVRGITNALLTNRSDIQGGVPCSS